MLFNVLSRILGGALITRNITKSDIDSIYELYSLEGWKGFTKEVVEKLFHSSYWVIVEDGDKIVGFGRYLTDHTLTMYLCEILVSKPYRGNGIGKMIINEMFQRHSHLRMDVLSDADSFYEGLRFRHLGKAYRRYRSE